MGSGFVGMVETLERIGVADVLLPFILIFTIVYAIMHNTNIFGGKADNRAENKKFHIAIALVIAFGIIIPHTLGQYPAGSDPIDIINQVIPGLSLGLIAILAVLLMLGIWGKKINVWEYPVGAWVVILSIIFVGLLFLESVNFVIWPRWANWMLDPEVKSIAITILVFGIIVWFITRDPKKKEGNSENGFMKVLSNLGKDDTPKSGD